LTELLARLSREARLPSGAVTPRHDAKR
jgi:hypothetical protein